MQLGTCFKRHTTTNGLFHNDQDGGVREEDDDDTTFADGASSTTLERPQWSDPNSHCRNHPVVDREEPLPTNLRGVGTTVQLSHAAMRTRPGILLNTSVVVRARPKIPVAGGEQHVGPASVATPLTRRRARNASRPCPTIYVATHRRPYCRAGAPMQHVFVNIFPYLTVQPTLPLQAGVGDASPS